MINPPRAAGHSQKGQFLFFSPKSLVGFSQKRSKISSAKVRLWSWQIPLKFQNRCYGSHQPVGMRLPSFSLIPRFMALGFTNSVQIRAGIDYTGFSPLDPSTTKLRRRTRDFVIRVCEDRGVDMCTFHIRSDAIVLKLNNQCAA